LSFGRLKFVQTTLSYGFVNTALDAQRVFGQALDRRRYLSITAESWGDNGLSGSACQLQNGSRDYFA
jgi:hypothetical protein